MGKPIVVFFSRSGITRGLAHDVAVAASAELEELLEDRGRAGLLGYLRSGYQSMRRRRTSLRPLLHDLTQSDLVIVGTPIWVAAPCTPIRTFLEDNRDRIKNVAFFLTCGGSGGERALEELTKVAGKTPLAELVLKAPQLRGDVRPMVERFVAKAMEGIATRPEATRGPEPIRPQA